MKDIELPMRVIVGDKAIDKTSLLFSELGLMGHSLVLSDKNTYRAAGEKVSRLIESSSLILDKPMGESIESACAKIKENNVDYVVGVGGGYVIDIAKVAAFRARIPYISIPTSAAHDGITSPQASIQGERKVSVRVHSPLAIIADTEIIRMAPTRLLSAGCADAVSNYTAVLDWELARDEINEYFGDYAASLSMMSAKIVMEKIDCIRDDVSILMEALISSGVAMGIAGSSRPCAGAEHQFSHAIDMICPDSSLHGEQCGVGTILMAYLHGIDWVKIKKVLETIGAPTTAKDLGVDDKCIIKALMEAHRIRDRYTILRDGLSREQAVDLAKKTLVI